MTILNLVSSKAVSSNQIVNVSEPLVPEFVYNAGIDPKAVMVFAVTAFAVLAVILGLGFRGVL